MWVGTLLKESTHSVHYAVSEEATIAGQLSEVRVCYMVRQRDLSINKVVQGRRYGWRQKHASVEASRRWDRFYKRIE